MDVSSIHADAVMVTQQALSSDIVAKRGGGCCTGMPLAVGSVAMDEAVVEAAVGPSATARVRRDGGGGGGVSVDAGVHRSPSRPRL